jgi:hypothetical protein
MLGQIVRQSSGQVVRSIMQSARQAGADRVRTGLQVAGKASDDVKNGLFGWMNRSRRPRTAGPDPAETDL